MASFNLARDSSDNPVQVLAPQDTTTTIGTSSGASVLLALPSGTVPGNIVEVAASAGIHWLFGTSGAVATSSNKYQGGGNLPYKVPVGATHLAFIASTGVASAICSVTLMV
jgi:hypothetical protein